MASSRSASQNIASSSRPLSLFPDLNDPSSASGPSAPVLTQSSLPTLTVEQVMAAQNDIDANHYTLRSCMETVAAVTNLSHRLQSKACEVHQLNAQLSLLQCMYRDARAEICALKAEIKELKRQTTSMARFGAPTYLTFDGRRGADSGAGNTVGVLGGSTGDRPANVLGGVGNTEVVPVLTAQDKGKKKRTAEEAKK